MIIEELKLTVPFKYFWLKTVVGVDLSKHCYECLKGKRDDRISPSRSEYEYLELGDSIYYLCGVSPSMELEKNFHLAFRPCLGTCIEEVQNGVVVRIRDAERLPISPDYIDPNDPHSGERLYARCRNWQFAYYFSKCLASK